MTSVRARMRPRICMCGLVLAVCKVATISLAEDVNLLLRMKLARLGAAMASRIAATETVTINSISVNPRRRLDGMSKDCPRSDWLAV